MAYNFGSMFTTSSMKSLLSLAIGLSTGVALASLGARVTNAQEIKHDTKPSNSLQHLLEKSDETPKPPPSIPLIEDARTIHNAVTIHFSPKGEKFLSSNIDPFLQQTYFYPNEGFFENLKLKQPSPITIETKQALQSMKTVVQNWLFGIKINDLQPEYRLSNFGYGLHVRKINLTANREATQKLGRKDGVVFGIEFEADQLSIGADQVDATDPVANAWLGTVGFEGIEISQKPTSKPLTIKTLALVSIDERYVPKIELLESSSNVDQLDLNFPPVGDVISPKLALEMNGRRFNVRQDYIGKLFQDNRDNILKTVQKMLSDYIEKQLPQSLTETLSNQHFVEFAQSIFVKAAGAPLNSGAKEYVLKMGAAKISADPNLELQLAASIYDPLKPDAPVNFKRSSDAKPKFGLMSENKYDIAVSMNRGLVNHLALMSYLRGYFKQIKTENGYEFGLIAAPLVDVVKGATGNEGSHLRIRARVSYRPNTIIQKLFVSERVIAGADVIGYLIPAPGPKRGLQFVMESIDPNSLWFPETNYANLGKPLASYVKDFIMGSIEKTNKEWAKTRKVYPQTIPLPPAFFGVDMGLVDVITDPNGHLIMFLNFPRGDSQ